MIVVIGLILILGLTVVIVGIPVFTIHTVINKRRVKKGLTERPLFNRNHRPTLVLPAPSVGRRQNFRIIGALVSLAIFIAAYFLVEAAVNTKVTSDVTDEYYIAKRSGTAMEVCIQAGIVRAAYLQAKDEDKYKEWEIIEQRDCRAAGLSNF